jgi:hypothetical protein
MGNYSSSLIFRFARKLTMVNSWMESTSLKWCPNPREGPLDAVMNALEQSGRCVLDTDGEAKPEIGYDYLFQNRTIIVTYH